MPAQTCLLLLDRPECLVAPVVLASCTECEFHIDAFDGSLHLKLLGVPEVRKCNTVRFIHVMVAIGAMKLQGLHLLDDAILYQSSRHSYSRRIPWCLTCKYNMGVGFHFVIGRITAVKVDGRTLRHEGYTISIINDDAHLTAWIRLEGVVK